MGSKPVLKDEFPALAPVPETVSEKSVSVSQSGKPLMNFASLFKNAVKKKHVKKMKWGLVRLTKNGVVDSLTPEEREAEEQEKNEAIQDERLRNAYIRLEKTRDVRREYDANYESPPELTVTSSEEEITEEEEVVTDEFEEDEFEPEI